MRLTHRGILSSLCGLAALWFSLAGAADARAQTPRELIQRGNQHYDVGRYAEALEAYEQAGEQLGDRPTAELLHDQAAAHFKLGQIDEARELWVRAATLKDAVFEAAARYNLGNCSYADALQAVENQDVPAALELLNRAVEQYRDATQLNPDLTNARANLELAEMLKEQIRQQTTTQPQSQPSSQPQQQEREQQQDQTSSQPSSQPSQTGDQSDGHEQRPSSQPASQPEQQQPESQPSQEPESQPAEAEEQEQSPASQPTEQPVTQPASDQEEQPATQVEMTRAEAERLLQLIRDAEQARRQMLRERETARYKPVDKDW